MTPDPSETDDHTLLVEIHTDVKSIKKEQEELKLSQKELRDDINEKIKEIRNRIDEHISDKELHAANCNSFNRRRAAGISGFAAACGTIVYFLGHIAGWW